ncbi:RCC1-like G exchanging factor-like protein [Neocloeon triangulifer]|uniref:RCC1-like G exchanging factor-like protein n=1 Tax=Neocloeon triangulifer TaxID=2078957 RepID=UPI00286EE91B|nr:RCC1-like G exchanging factor-like protein [Neocloeon triangulifer]
MSQCCAGVLRTNLCTTSLNFTISRHFGRIVKRFPLYPDDKPIESIPEYAYGKPNKDKRQLFAWGLSEHGGLGILRQFRKGSRSRQTAPKYLHRPCRAQFGDLNRVTDVACGFGFTLFSVCTNSSLKVYGSGINTDSQLGYQCQRKEAPLELLLSPVPIRLPIEAKEHVAVVAAGRAHSLVLVEKEKGKGGRVLAFGNNSYGQCGRAVEEGEQYLGSHRVNCIDGVGDAAVRSVSCGQDHSLFINAKGELFACGWGDDGQTGQSAPGKLGRPSKVKGALEGVDVLKAVSSGDCNLAINDSGDLFGWGNSEYGQLLQPNTTQVYSPIKLDLQEVGPVIDVAAGGSFCAVLNEKNQIWVWGFGLLGLGPKVVQIGKPQMIPETLLGQSDFAWRKTRITSIQAGLFHLAAVSAEGDLFTWGRNKEGCLGLGHTRDQPFPLRVAIGASVLKVSCGVDHMAAVCKPFF